MHNKLHNKLKYNSRKIYSYNTMECNKKADGQKKVKRNVNRTEKKTSTIKRRKVNNVKEENLEISVTQEGTTQSKITVIINKK